MTRLEIILAAALTGSIAFGFIHRAKSSAPAPVPIPSTAAAEPTPRFQMLQAGPHVLRLDTTTGTTWLWDAFTEEFCDVTPASK